MKATGIVRRYLRQQIEIQEDFSYESNRNRAAH